MSKKDWVKSFLDAGHEFVMTEPEYEGETPQIDWFVLDVDYHNGPKCAKCGWCDCQHCVKSENIPRCTKA